MKRLVKIFLDLSMIIILGSVITIDTQPVKYKAMRLFNAFTAQDMVAPIPKEIELPDRLTKPFESEALKILDRIDDTELSYKKMHLTSKGWYFITAYCSCSKCCYPSTNMTASGVECHYADYEHRYDEPTTCAIDRKIHKFGDTFYLKSADRVYVGEDTGNLVKGKHLDLYFPDHSYVQSYGSHWEEVFDISFETVTFRVGDFHIREHFERPKHPYWQVKLHEECFGKNINIEGFGH